MQKLHFPRLCVCVCVRERERERFDALIKWAGVNQFLNFKCLLYNYAILVIESMKGTFSKAEVLMKQVYRKQKQF